MCGSKFFPLHSPRVNPQQHFASIVKAAISGAKLGWTTEAGTEDDNENGGDAGDGNGGGGNGGNGGGQDTGGGLEP